MSKHRVSVLVDGPNEEEKARKLLVKNTPESELNKYDGLVTGWATEVEVAEMQRSGLQVEASPAQEGAAAMAENVTSLPAQQASQVCVKFRGPMRPQWQELMTKNNVHVLGKQGVETYKLHASPEALRELSAANALREAWMEPPVSKATSDVYEDLKSAADREGVPQVASAGMLAMGGVSPKPAAEPPALYDVFVYRRSTLPAIREKLQQSLGVEVVQSAPRGVRIKVAAGAPILEEITRWPEVRIVCKHQSPRLMCTAGAATIGVTALRLAVPPKWTGKNELIAVFDSGIDGKHPDLKPAMHSKLPMGGARPKDDIGHGTHVAGIIAGRGAAGGPTGVATAAKLIDRPMVNDTGELILPINYDDLFGPAAAAGAKIFNLSWGWAIGGDYDQGSRQVDEFAYANPDILLVIAAGNSGRAGDGSYNFGTLAAPASAKNALTVGACSLLCDCKPGCSCKSSHGQKWPQFFAVAPASNDPVYAKKAGSVTAVGISSRGPTTHESIKPDLLAPGVLVESTRSKHVQNPGIFENGCPTFDEIHYACLSGTSMATPFVSGAAALVRQYLREEHNMPTPTAALIKATLIAAAIPVPPNPANRQDKCGFPDFDQGFGVLDISTILPHPAAPADRKLILADIRNDSPEALASRQPAGSAIRSFRSYRFQIPAGATQPLRVVLCWTDAPGVFLQNNLQLDLATPDGAAPHTGNEQHVFQRNPLLLDHTDKRNNVEVITIAKPEPGEYRARVFAQNTSHPNQGYALVIIGPVVPTP